MPPTTRQVLHATALRDVIAAVPFQCGFHPRHSVVVLSLRGPRRRVGLVTRLDLPEPEDVQEAVEELVGFVVRDEGSATMVLVYDDLEWDPAQPPRLDFVEALLAALATAQVPALDAIYATPERYWSYLCRDPRCCPADGERVADARASPVAAAYVLAGMAPVADRETLAARVQPSRPLLVAAVADSTWRWLAALAADLDAAFGRGPRGADGQARADETGRQHTASAVALLETMLEDYRSHAGSLSVEQAGQLIAVLQSPTSRDELLIRFCRTGLPAQALAAADLPAEPVGDEPFDPASEDAVERLLVDLCAQVEGPLACAPLALLGWHSWARGEGALARIAVDRALAEDPTYRLAALLSTLLDHAVAPDWVGAMRQEDERAS
jgi:hypothetical protein